jgi:hypothetical protein
LGGLLDFLKTTFISKLSYAAVFIGVVVIFVLSNELKSRNQEINLLQSEKHRCEIVSEIQSNKIKMYKDKVDEAKEEARVQSAQIESLANENRVRIVEKLIKDDSCEQKLRLIEQQIEDFCKYPREVDK